MTTTPFDRRSLLASAAGLLGASRLRRSNGVVVMGASPGDVL